MAAPATIKRGDEISLLDELSQDSDPQATFKNELMNRIKLGQVVPVISNWLRMEHVFPNIANLPARLYGGNPPANIPGQAVENYLAQAWANTLKYPLSDRYELARVAQFSAVLSKRLNQDLLTAKKNYLRFAKLMYLEYVRNNRPDPDPDPDLFGRLKDRYDSGSSFSDLVQEAGFSQFGPTQEDPLRLLARLPFRVYVTTSQHDFIERALVAEKRTPYTRVCLWSGSVADLLPEHNPDDEVVPTKDNPLVYHLYGLEQYPTTLVLSEDDYLDFLVEATHDNDTNHPLIPLTLRGALSSATLMMLGFRLQDWDFRVLFRGVVNYKSIDSPRPSKSLIIQLAPGEQYQIDNDQAARSFLEDYFSPSSFQLRWSRSDAFISSLFADYTDWVGRQ